MILCLHILLSWYGMVWYDMIWYGMVWYGIVWYDYGYDMGIVWYGYGMDMVCIIIVISMYSIKYAYKFDQIQH